MFNYSNKFRHHPFEKLFLEITPKSYLELFDEKFANQKMVYLSPHAEEVLEEIEPDTVYIIGGIVDRVGEKKIPKHATKLVADQENIICRQLPLDKYLP